MPKISTHINLALKLFEKLDIENETAFLLGSAYADCGYKDRRQMLKNHYKNTPEDFCNLKAFLKENVLDDFNFGWYFHLWTDNRIRHMDLEDISDYDRVIFDMPRVQPVVLKLAEKEFCGREKQALENILDMANRPVPLYLPSEEKAEKYKEILNNLAARFAEIYVFFTT